MNSFFKKNGPLISTYFIIAIVFWLIFLIIIPQLYMLDLAFRPNLPPSISGPIVPKIFARLPSSDDIKFTFAPHDSILFAK